MATWTVRKYVKANGRCPIDEWRESKKLTAKDRGAIDGVILAIEATATNALFPPEKFKKYHGTELYEVKAKGPGKQLRPLAEKDANGEIVLFWGSIEKDGELEGGDVAKAQNLAKDWKDGKGSVKDYWED
jgi:hypothetical protein